MLDDSRDTYNEFLKVVNLFTQDFIDTARFVKESRSFLGEASDIMRELEAILGWDERKERERAEQEQQAWTRPTILIGGSKEIKEEKPKPGRVDLKGLYGSYRRLPKNVSTSRPAVLSFSA